jgi:hypothetical protein
MAVLIFVYTLYSPYILKFISRDLAELKTEHHLKADRVDNDIPKIYC